MEVATAADLEGPQKTTVRGPEEVCRINYARHCQCCGKRGHSVATCQFRQGSCYKCGERGHLQVMCKQGKQSTMSSKAEVNQLKPTNEEEDDPGIWTITGGHSESYHVHLKLDQIPIKMELDTGAAVSVMSEQQWKETFTETKPLEPYTGKPLHGYSGHEVQVVGQVMVNVEYGNQRRELPLLIVTGQQRPSLFGRDWLHSIQIEWTEVHQIRRGQEADIVNRFPLVFQKGVGTIKGYKADIRLKEGAKPIFKKSRSVAYALQPLLEAELDQMQRDGILEPVENSDWATPLVIVPKNNGRIRVCGDFKVTINQCWRLSYTPCPQQKIFCPFSRRSSIHQIGFSPSILAVTSR